MKAYNQTPIINALMRLSNCFFLLFFLLIGCQDEQNLTFAPLSIQGEQCADCPKIAINLPKAIEETRIARSVNTALREEVIALLHFDEALEVSDIGTAIESFKSGFSELQEKYEDESTPWEARIDAEITYEDAALLTISLDAYIFTGGAHGYTSKRFLNFDKIKGEELENWRLFKDSLAFRDLAERHFRMKENIPSDKPINYTGFMFEQDSFYLPENIGFTEKGMKLLYNQYEVSSFADGTIELILPYEEVQKFLKPKIGS